MIDLRSDTCSRPPMRRAMAEAAVGDDVYSDDPTVRLLEERTADLLGKEDFVYMVTAS
jgi:threonine aldolase